ncbi:hypothetical protein OF83DRAFT_1065788, partial [Amylostereum chailletii]
PVSSLFGLLGVALGSVNFPVGIQCSPIAGGAQCSQQTTCCSDTVSNGLINLNCIPSNL